MDYKLVARKAKSDNYNLASSSTNLRNNALKKISVALDENRTQIFQANMEDLANATDLPKPLQSRLKFDEEKLDACISGIKDLIQLDDPLNDIILERQLDDGLLLQKVSCPIGVIGVIFESRPDALVQISSLCIKSGNCAILKGGRESKMTNQALFSIIHKTGVSAGLPEGFLSMVEDRSAIGDLLKCHDSIDLIIPRGSNEFVQYIMENSRIPVMGHADGICHIYVDKDVDFSKAISIVIDSKTQYPAACNAVETLLIHHDIATDFIEELSEKAPEIQLISAQGEEDYVEHLDKILTYKVVSGIDEATNHINRYGSHHTDSILTKDQGKAKKFMDTVDSSSVYHNCSTRFADGFRYGFGAEVGISTSKLHARGPVGLDGLVTYKYKLFGDGQIVDDYAKGIKQFSFKDSP